jgi:hypothetical protein
MSDKSDITSLVKQYRGGDIDGKDLAKMEKEGTITKTERRSIVKLAKKDPPKELSDRQKQRLAVKEKKAQPRERLTFEERREKYSDLDDQQMERYKEASAYVVCLGCRQKGHYLKDCPMASSGAYDGGGQGYDNSYYSGGDRGNRSRNNVPTVSGSDNKPSGGGLICFNCGANDHALRACTVPRDPKGALPFATCFICNGKGHLSRDCPENANGLYPKGGCCHICLQKDHLVKDCPNRTEEDKQNWIEEQERKKREKEEKELGPKVSGLTADEGDGGAEYMEPIKTRFDNDSDSNSDNDDSKKRKKSSKKEKKSHKKKRT